MNLADLALQLIELEKLVKSNYEQTRRKEKINKFDSTIKSKIVALKLIRPYSFIHTPWKEKRRYK